MKRAAFDTLGCKLSFAESSSWARAFEAAGFEIVDAGEPADIYVVNTCSVTEHADKKGRNLIRRLHRKAPGARIIVAGCQAQLRAEQLAELDGVWAVVGSDYKGELLAIATAESIPQKIFVKPIEQSRKFFAAHSSTGRTRAFLKVQDGCDYHCTYCTVPLARGDSRNAPIADIVAQAEAIAASGFKEVVLTGVNTGDFGKSTGESFFDLIKALNAVEGIERYRISSIEPNLLTEEIVDWIASGTKFLPHFHIPLQSGCDRVLAAMHRRYNTDFFRRRIEYIRGKMEHVFFGIDVIAGFPGETDADFEQTYRFLEQIHPAFIHIFPYSRRAGTPAADMPGQVQESVKTERVARLEELCSRLHAEFCEANCGRREQVLFESTVRDGKMFGYSRNYIKVERDYDPALVREIVDVIL
ncbi:MAG: tRNA (N(6)-L-threonylcarbamoyladenosine(37)-C(2))-methylthiotransferase MtaB [Bacteroidales bacterium]|nr:tRNA (N(6)-L-threonylcarbamoyladenosine(37)-C(2))-methylthiotransferase MtaB [Bacteroidales bacterium]